MKTHELSEKLEAIALLSRVIGANAQKAMAYQVDDEQYNKLLQSNQKRQDVCSEIIEEIINAFEAA